MKAKPFITTDNIFADLGLKNAEELKTRSDLMSEVVRIIRNSELTQKEIAKILGISAPKVSALMTGKINDFSNDTLVQYLSLLGCNIEIRVTSVQRVSRKMKRGKIRVKRPIRLRISRQRKAKIRERP
ncbi:MAG TPA: helix-turn-helix transcriptional regulator [Rhabdochlamydiaceae bacterium]|nr:helix-turn-helix transcriptional regulator [Rhabdochlamydiaceae bacterium]